MATVYILTNESMPEVIKVGITSDLVQRLKQLDNTSTPLPFECFYAVEVEEAAKIEKLMHQGLDDYRIRQNREFFNCAPEKAKSLLQIAETMGGTDVTPSSAVVNDLGDLQALEAAHKKRGRFNIASLGIEPGEVLMFKKDPGITVSVIDEHYVNYLGEKHSLSSAALAALQQQGYDWSAVQGPAWWMYHGKTLTSLKNSD